ncbi:MAG: ABC-type transport auxiliary lipoprotein family protein [Parvibaculum sp.]
MVGVMLGKWIRHAFLAVAIVPLSACAIADIGSGPAPSLYTLKAPAVLAETGGQAAGQLVVEEFSAPAALDTTRIVFQPSENEIAYYANARWSDRSPRMIASLLVETIASSGRFPAVIGPGSNARMDLALVGDIRSFAAYREAAAGFGQETTKVRVALYVRLLRARDRSIIASREFSAEAPAGSGMANVIAAYDAALGTVLTEVSDWAFTRSQTASSAR